MDSSEKKSFEDYYKAYNETVKGFIMKRVENEDAAEDLVMDVWEKCLKSFDRFDEEKASFATWIFVITRNCIKNYYRDNKEHEEAKEEYFLHDGFEDNIVQAQYLSMLRDTLATAMLDLPLVQREIIKQKFFMNRNSSEIAEELGISAGNVRVYLSRALGKLRKYFLDNDIRW